MLHTDSIARIFEPGGAADTSLMFVEPDDVARAASSVGVAAWTLLLGAMQLRDAGQRSPANAWLNHAGRQPAEGDLFRAELLGEAGKGLFDSDRFQDACNTLDSAEAIWRDACDQAAEACSDPEAASALSLQLAPMLEAAGHPQAADVAAGKGREAMSLAQQWLEERAVWARCDVTNTLVRVLARGGLFDDARRILDEEIHWLASNFTVPAKPVSALALAERTMSPRVRRGAYLLMLALGELELAAERYEESASAFGEAAGVYENEVADYNDINRLLRAKFNQANSLLRLHRIQEAIDIYELCEEGFNSIGQDDAAQRVAHAKLFARSLEDDEDA